MGRNEAQWTYTVQGPPPAPTGAYPDADGTEEMIASPWQKIKQEEVNSLGKFCQSACAAEDRPSTPKRAHPDSAGYSKNIQPIQERINHFQDAQNTQKTPPIKRGQCPAKASGILLRPMGRLKIELKGCRGSCESVSRKRFTVARFQNCDKKCTLKGFKRFLTPLEWVKKNHAPFPQKTAKSVTCFLQFAIYGGSHEQVV